MAPKPKDPPVNTYINVKIPPDLHQDLKLASMATGEPLSEIIRMAIARHLQHLMNDSVSFRQQLKEVVDRMSRLGEQILSHERYDRLIREHQDTVRANMRTPDQARADAGLPSEDDAGRKDES